MHNFQILLAFLTVRLFKISLANCISEVGQDRCCSVVLFASLTLVLIRFRWDMWRQ